MNWRRVRVETVALETRDTIDPQSLDCPLVEHYSIPSLEATGLPELVPPDEILSAKQVLRGGEVMVSRLNPRKARVLRVPETLAQPTIASGEFVVMQPSGVDGDFLKYALLSEDVRQHLHSCVQSVTRSHQRIRPDHLLKMPIHIPEFETQVAIRDYVDRETAHIDKLITKQKSLIERLDEYRTALVTRVVTKGLPAVAAEAAGLDPEPALKDSGVAWLGEVPEHWEVGQLRRAFFIVNGGTPAIGDDGNWDGEIVWLTPDDLGRNEGRSISEGRRNITPEGVRNSGARVSPPNSVVLSTRAPIGHIAIADLPAATNQGCRTLVPTAGAVSGFAYYSLLASRVLLQAAGKGSTFMELSAADLAQHRLPLPPPNEQQAIASFLDAQSSRIDTLRAKAELSIERLQEYRSALISAAVTGKIDVRDKTLVGGGV